MAAHDGDAKLVQGRLAVARAAPPTEIRSHTTQLTHDPALGFPSVEFAIAGYLNNREQVPCRVTG